MDNPLKTQVGGTHYKDLKIQPAELFDLIHMQPMAMMALKYLTRWRKKNGQEDLKKAIHCLYLQEMFNAPRATKVNQFLQQFPVAERAIMTEI
ncbi:MAG: DUF3310 domain-containing protein, partial [Thermoguttaceae bacterium]|nr:DUF3310 domain-containing protein [Thermoguttaceae bacterium]